MIILSIVLCPHVVNKVGAWLSLLFVTWIKDASQNNSAQLVNPFTTGFGALQNRPFQRSGASQNDRAQLGNPFTTGFGALQNGIPK